MFFSFFDTANNISDCELELDSGATSHLIKDESLFNETDKRYKGTKANANSNKSVEGRGKMKKKERKRNDLSGQECQMN